MSVEQPRIRIFLMQDGTKVGHQFTQAQTDAFLADNAGSSLVR